MELPLGLAAGWTFWRIALFIKRIGQESIDLEPFWRLLGSELQRCPNAHFASRPGAGVDTGHWLDLFAGQERHHSQDRR